MQVSVSAGFESWRRRSRLSAYNDIVKEVDLRASEGKAAAGPKPVAPVPGAGRSAAERLEELQVLRDQHLITEDEYQAKRRAILEGL